MIEILQSTLRELRAAAASQIEPGQVRRKPLRFDPDTSDLVVEVPQPCASLAVEVGEPGKKLPGDGEWCTFAGAGRSTRALIARAADPARAMSAASVREKRRRPDRRENGLFRPGRRHHPGLAPGPGGRREARIEHQQQHPVPSRAFERCCPMRVQPDNPDNRAQACR